MRLESFICKVALPFRPQDLEVEARLDIYLPAALGAQHDLEVSRRAARRLIDQGAVYLDRKRVRVPKRRVTEGMRIEVWLDPAAPGAKQAWPRLGQEHLLYQDQDLVAVAKPSGLPALATVSNAVDDLESQVRRLLGKPGGRPEFLHAVHRLDRGTSGLMLLARSRRAAKALGEALAGRRVKKRYSALVWLRDPRPEEAGQGSWVVRDRLEVRKEGGKAYAERVGLGGRRAETAMRILEVRGELARVEARPATGRLHQVRVHLAESGLPVVGDRLYGPGWEDTGGGASGPRPRLMLHAAGLAFAHPVSRAPLQLDCPPPEEMVAFFR